MVYKSSWLELENAVGGRSTIAGSPAEIKARSAAMRPWLKQLQPEPSNAVRTWEGEVEGIRYRVYRPVLAVTTILPLGIWAHGGGWMTGDLDNDDYFCRAVAEGIPSVVISVDYRLTPIYPMPTQLNDCLKVYKWVMPHFLEACD